MGLSTILIISLAAGVVLVIGGGVMMYMANLVKSAYEIKVQISSDVDERLTKMGEDIDKKSRWIKRELAEEIDKIRVSLTTESAKKFQEMAEPLLKQVEALEQAVRSERTEWVKAVDTDRQSLTEVDGRIRAVRRDIKRIEERLGLAAQPETAAAADPSAAGKGLATPPSVDGAAASQPAAAAQPAAAPPPAKPAAKPGVPVAVSTMLREFGDT